MVNNIDKLGYFKLVLQNIETYGFHITSVLEEENFTPFAYSTGLFENYNIPEIFISGLGPNLSNELMHSYAEKFKKNELPLYQKINNLTDRFPVVLIPLKSEDLVNHTLSSFKYYKNRPFSYIQLIFPDLNGLFPNEKSYNYDQEILGDFYITETI